MAYWLDSGSKGLGSRSGWGIVLCSQTKHLTLPLFLFTHEYKRIVANCRGSRIKCWGVISWWTLACQPGGSSDDLCRSCHGIWVKLRLGETLGLSAGFTLPSRVKNYVCPYFTSTAGWISNYLSSLGKDGWTWIICSGKFVKKKNPSADERLRPKIPANFFLWKYKWERQCLSMKIRTPCFLGLSIN